MCPLSIVPVPPPPPPIIPSVWIPISSKNCVVCSEGLSPLSAGVIHTCYLFGVALFYNKMLLLIFFLTLELFLETRTVDRRPKRGKWGISAADNVAKWSQN